MCTSCTHLLDMHDDHMMPETTNVVELQTTQSASIGAVTAVTNCCANCVEPLPFLGKPAMRTRWMAGADSQKSRLMSRLIQVRQHQINESGFVISAINKYMLGKISIRCNRIVHWVHLRCAGIRQTQYTDTWTCYIYMNI